VKNEDVLLTTKETRNVLHTVQRRKANWMHGIGLNCRLKHVIEGKRKGRKRRGRRRMQLLNYFKEMGKRTLKDTIIYEPTGEIACEEATDL
jgi:hypothetical protein